MGKLRDALQDIFGGDCYLDGSSIKEQNRVFSIRKNSEDQVVGLKVDGCIIENNSERCDGLFFVWRPSVARFAIVLVELKGTDTNKAASQFASTANYLISLTKCNQGDHHAWMKDKLSLPAPISHNSCLLAVAVSKKGLPQSFDTKMRLKKMYRIKFMHFQPGGATGLSVGNILRLVFREGS